MGNEVEERSWGTWYTSGSINLVLQLPRGPCEGDHPTWSVRTLGWSAKVRCLIHPYRDSGKPGGGAGFMGYRQNSSCPLVFQSGPTQVIARVLWWVGVTTAEEIQKDQGQNWIPGLWHCQGWRVRSQDQVHSTKQRSHFSKLKGFKT